MKNCLKKHFFAVVLLFLPASFAFSQYNVGVLQFDLPEDWEIEEEGMSLFAVSPDENFYVTGMIFYGLPDIAAVRTGIFPLISDMFRDLQITEEKTGVVQGTYPCLMITATGIYKELNSQLYMLIVNGGDHFPILQIFGSNEGWGIYDALAAEIADRVQLTF